MIRRSSAWIALAQTWLALLWLGVDTRPSAAQERWLLVPVLTAAPPRDISLSELSTPFETALRKRDQNVLTNPEAGLLFETRHSSEPVKLNNDELTRLLRSVGLAARHLALGELPQAQQAMEGVYSLSGPARDFLNREAARARRIFDTCLMTAYLWERDDKPQQALRQMMECSRNFPGFRPEGRAYPPELRAVFEQAKQQLSQQPSTTLLVKSQSSAGCRVRLNGIEVGKSPMSFSDVRAGVTRVQLECQPGVPGRSHAVELKAGENLLEIDAEFDANAHSQSGLWLQYDSATSRDARIDKDLMQLQKVLGAAHVVGLVIEGSAYPVIHVRALADPGYEVATLSYSRGEGFSAEAIAAALAELMPKKPAPKALPSAPEETPIVLAAGSNSVFAPRATEGAEPEPPNQQNALLGAALAVIGTGGIATGWVLYALRYEYRNDQLTHAEDAAVSAARYNPQPAWALGVTAAGALMFSWSEYFWLPNANEIPALAWVAGGLGSAVGLLGLGFSVFGDRCTGGSGDGSFALGCSRLHSDVIFGPMIALNALPLLSVPLAYAIRVWARPSTKASLPSLVLNVETAPSGGALIRLRGAF
jgi:hypothetical protein